MKQTIDQQAVSDWLMEGDAAIRWQTMRDILNSPAANWKAERKRVGEQGWGKRLLALRDSGGTWGGGLYTPKWTSTNYTLLALRDMGLPRDNPAGGTAAKLLLGRLTGEAFQKRLPRLDLCIKGMYLSLNVYFGVRDDRVDMLVRQILADQMADGGWNCAHLRNPVHHSSLHTTMNVLDGLADYMEYRRRTPVELRNAVAKAIARAHEFILAHRLFKSDKTGKVIREAFTKFSFPPRWRWDVLRGLDHFRRMNVPDERLGDAIDLLQSKRGPDDRWKLENHHRGKEFFQLEKPGQPSRWNTLRALRVLQWWGIACNPD